MTKPESPTPKPARTEPTPSRIRREGLGRVPSTPYPKKFPPIVAPPTPHK